MLVLARKLNESIMIGEEIEVIVIDIKADQIKLGIKAPRNVAVHRKEIYEEIKGQNISAANAVFDPAKLRDLSDIFRDRGKKDTKD